MSDYRQIANQVLGRLKASQGDGRWDDHLSLATWEWPQGVAMFAMFKVFEATKDPELLRWIRSLFETDYYHVSISTDVIGVEVADGAACE